MKGGTVQISWHGSDPILSLDFHLSSGLLATGGADRDIKLWSLHRVEKSNSLPSATFKANLSYHGSAVNVVRFSPSGELLASGADSGELLIWKIIQSNDEIPAWKVWKTLRFHLKDVLDLGWSPDGAFLVSGSVDNTCIIWNVIKGTVEQVLADHQHYVQGVTWDPAGKYVASLSGDRTCRIYSQQLPKKSKSKEKKENSERTVFTCQQVLCKRDNPANATSVAKVDADGSLKQVAAPKQYLFYDENMPSFFRRLSWSPDGSFLILPAGVEKQLPDLGSCSVSYVVSRSDLSRPILQLPASSKPVIASRFCPVVFSLSPLKSWKHDTRVPGVAAFKLPYKLVFAVATLNSVYIYDTEQSCPIAIFGGLHYAPITDLAWSFDATFLAVSSQDGYCTLVGFDEGDLGIPLPIRDLPPNIACRMHSFSKARNDDSEIQSHAKDLSKKATDVPFKNKLHTEEVPLAKGESLKRRVDNPTEPPRVRRIQPKPVSEDLEESPVLKSQTNDQINSSGKDGFDLKKTSVNIQLGRLTSVLPFKVIQQKSGLVTEVEGKGSNLVPVTPDEASREQTVCVQNLAMAPGDDIYGDQDKQQASNPSSTNHKSFGDTASGPATPLCQEHVCMGMSMSNFQKPRDQYADIYVRPLKFRRISPNLIPDDLDKPTTLKPASSETSLPSNGIPGLQPV